MSTTDLNTLTDPALYQIATLDDEVRADRSCVALLQLFRDELLAAGIDGVEAGSRAHGADYFLREFIIGDRRENILELAYGRVRQFAGHWYIVRTMEPNREELSSILAGVAGFYAFLTRHGKVPAELRDEVAAECRELDYYQRRIETFWAITGDGFTAWRNLCPLPPAGA